MASDGQIEAVTRPVPTDGFVRDRLEDWVIVAVQATGRIRLHVVGKGSVSGRPVVTSALAAIHADGVVVRTTSGTVYALLGKMAAAVSPTHLAALQLALAGWFGNRRCGDIE